MTTYFGNVLKAHTADRTKSIPSFLVYCGNVGIQVLLQTKGLATYLAQVLFQVFVHCSNVSRDFILSAEKRSTERTGRVVLRDACLYKQGPTKKEKAAARRGSQGVSIERFPVLSLGHSICSESSLVLTVRCGTSAW